MRMGPASGYEQQLNFLQVRPALRDVRQVLGRAVEEIRSLQIPTKGLTFVRGDVVTKS